jgi:hypothetical protein
MKHVDLYCRAKRQQLEHRLHGNEVTGNVNEQPSPAMGRSVVNIYNWNSGG